MGVRLAAHGRTDTPCMLFQNSMTSTGYVKAFPKNVQEAQIDRKQDLEEQGATLVRAVVHTVDVHVRWSRSGTFAVGCRARTACWNLLVGYLVG